MLAPATTDCAPFLPAEPHVAFTEVSACDTSTCWDAGRLGMIALRPVANLVAHAVHACAFVPVSLRKARPSVASVPV